MANTDRLGHRITCLLAEYQRLSEEWRLHTSDIRWYFWLAFAVHAFVLPLVVRMDSKLLDQISAPLFLFLVFVVVASLDAACKSRRYAQECEDHREELREQLNTSDGLFESAKPCFKRVHIEGCEGSTFALLVILLLATLGVDLILLRLWNPSH